MTTTTHTAYNEQPGQLQLLIAHSDVPTTSTCKA